LFISLAVTYTVTYLVDKKTDDKNVGDVDKKVDFESGDIESDC